MEERRGGASVLQARPRTGLFKLQAVDRVRISGLSALLVRFQTTKTGKIRINPNNMLSDGTWSTFRHVTLIHVENYSCSRTSSFHYRPQTKFAKVMFSQVSVCPQGGGRVWQEGGMHGGGMRGRGACMAEGMYGWGEGVCGRGACVVWGCVAGGVHGRRDGHCSGWHASYRNVFLFTYMDPLSLQLDTLPWSCYRISCFCRIFTGCLVFQKISQKNLSNDWEGGD